MRNGAPMKEHSLFEICTASSSLAGPLVACSMFLLSACGAEDSGEVRLTTWGEEFIEEGIPAAEFADDFEARFDEFLVVLGQVRARNQDHEFSVADTYLVDLTAPGPHELTTRALPEGDWSEVEYGIVPIEAETILHPSADADARDRMEAGPYSISVKGEARRGDERYTFDWSFGGTTRYTNCVQVVGGRQEPGFRIGGGGRETVELTIHGDHFFYDDLAGDAALRFEAIADADADGDGDVTLDELAAVSLVDLPADRYGTGNFSGVDDLRAFVEALVSNLGHFNGEGHCLPR